MSAGQLQRRAVNGVMIGLTYLAALGAIVPLVLILWQLIRRGASSVSWSFLTHMPVPSGEEGGGMANAIAGSGVIVAIASAIGLPIGVGAGLYLAERGNARLAATVRFLADVLNGLPSIVLGIFAWQLLVRPFHHFSALAGGVALAAMMIPFVSRTTEEMIRVVPRALREAALALGYSRWRTSLTVVLRTALPGIVTGVLVAIGRIAGETAPLLFTAFGNQFWSLSPFRPIAALPMQLYVYAISPFNDWRAQAWAGALVLVGLVLVLSVAARFIARHPFRTGAD
jgi:phosphate transport system permease protein